MARETKAHREYGNELPSVTTILGVLRKIGLEQWYMRNTYEFCQNAMKKGKTVGTATHAAIESFILTGEMKVETEWPDEVTFALKSFVKFKKENPVEIKLAEPALFSPKNGYNGTIDAPCPPVLYDWKTGEAKLEEAPKSWPDWKFQSAAYISLWNENHPEALINRAFIIGLAKDKIGYSITEMNQQEITDCFNEVFLPALRIYNYQHKKEK